MLSADDAPPCDRPNLSKDYLAGAAPEEWIPLRSRSSTPRSASTCGSARSVSAIDVASRHVLADDGRPFPSTASCSPPARSRCACPSRAPTSRMSSRCARSPTAAPSSGAQRAPGRRSCSAQASSVSKSPRALRVARHRGACRRARRAADGEVARAGARRFIRALHEQHGVRVPPGETAPRSRPARSILNGGATLEADLVVAGIGVRPRTELAERAGLAVDRGVAGRRVPGDERGRNLRRRRHRPLARHPHSGERLRVEHWVVAERQGQTAARNMLGGVSRSRPSPSSGASTTTCRSTMSGTPRPGMPCCVEGSIAARDCLVRYVRGEETVAVASIGRDAETLRWEALMERAGERPRERALSPALA